MDRPKNLKWKLPLLALWVAVLGFWIWLELPCVFRQVTGLICPGCGMTRAWAAALQLDLAGAFWRHPMFWSVPVLGLYILYDGNIFPNRRVNNWILGLLMAGFGICYGIRLTAFLKGALPL